MTPAILPKLAVWKFASCDGCQLALLDCEDELLAIADQIEVAYFVEASRARRPGPYDLSLVEGSITTPADIGRIQDIRRDSKYLVTIGACATAGGIQALRNFDDVDAFARIVYPRPEHIAALATSSPIADHVAVDFELRGCPIDKRQLVEVISAFLNGRRPVVPPGRRPRGASAFMDNFHLNDRVWLSDDYLDLPRGAVGVVIGAGSVVGAASVVTGNVPPGVVVAGAPARVIREITDADRDWTYRPPRDLG